MFARRTNWIAPIMVAVVALLSMKARSDVLLGPIVRPDTGHSYYLLTASAWSDAVPQAIALGGHLATINDADENEWVRTMVLAFDSASRRGWIGLTDQVVEGEFRWTNNALLTYVNWNPGQPDNAGNEDFVEMTPDGGWSDAVDLPAGEGRFGIVEVPVTPVNDECAACIDVSEGAYFGSTDAATGTITSSCGSADTRDTWYCYTSSQTGTARVSLCQAGFDTTLTVSAVCSGAVIACNDNGCAGVGSRVEFPVVQDGNYRIRIAGNSDATGGFLLEITNPPNILLGPVENPATGGTYYLLTDSTWIQAEQDAVALGGHLVTINNAAENEWVRDNLLTFDGIDRQGWLGLNDAAVEGTFQWVSGSPAGYLNWAAGQPDNAGNADYAAMNPNGTWHDTTNAPGAFVYGIVEIPGEPPVGDLNCDGSVDAGDVPAFALALVDAAAYVQAYPSCDVELADVSGDGLTNGRDVGPFVGLLLGP